MEKKYIEKIVICGTTTNLLKLNIPFTGIIKHCLDYGHRHHQVLAEKFYPLVNVINETNFWFVFSEKSIKNATFIIDVGNFIGEYKIKTYTPKIMKIYKSITNTMAIENVIRYSFTHIFAETIMRDWDKWHGHRFVQTPKSNLRINKSDLSLYFFETFEKEYKENIYPKNFGNFYYKTKKYFGLMSPKKGEAKWYWDNFIKGKFNF